MNQGKSDMRMTDGDGDIEMQKRREGKEGGLDKGKRKFGGRMNG